MPKKEQKPNVDKNLEESFKKITTSFSSDLSNAINNINFETFSKNLQNSINEVDFSKISDNLKIGIEKSIGNIDVSGMSDNLKMGIEKSIGNNFGKSSKSMKKVEGGLNNAIEASSKKLGSGSFFKSALKGIAGFIGKSMKFVFNQITDGIKSAFGEIGKMLSKLGLGEILNIASNFITDMLSGNFISGIVGLVGSVANLVLDKLISIDKMAEEISKETGISFSEMFDRAYNSFTQIQSNLKNLGVTTEDIAKNFSSISKTFATTDISDKFLTNISLISAKTGLTGDEAAEAVSSFQSISGSSKETAMNNIGIAYNLAKSSKTPLKMVINDIAKNSGIMAKYSGKFLENNIKAAISARKLGISISDIAKSADGLLNIEESVTAQFEASVLLGRDINLDAARYYALMGNLEGVQSEILKIVGSEAEWTAMMPLQRQALSKALGMNEEQLGKIIGRKKEEIEAEEKMAKSIESARKSAVDLYEAFGGEKLVGYITQIKTTLESIGNKVLKILLGSDEVKSGFEGILSFLNKIDEGLSDPENGIYKAVKGVRDFFAEFFDDNKTNSVEKFLNNINDAFKWIKDNGSTIIKIITLIVAALAINSVLQQWGKLRNILSGIHGMNGVGNTSGPNSNVGNNNGYQKIDYKTQQPIKPGSVGAAGGGFTGFIKNAGSFLSNPIKSIKTAIKANGVKGLKSFLKLGAISSLIEGILLIPDIISMMSDENMPKEKKDSEVSKMVLSRLGGVIGGAGLTAAIGALTGGTGFLLSTLTYWIGDKVGSWLMEQISDIFGLEFIGRSIRENFFPGQINKDEKNVSDFVLDPHGKLLSASKGTLKFNKNDTIIGGTNLFDGGNSNNNELLDLIKEQNKLLKEISEKEKNLPQLIVKNNVSGTRVELEKFNNKIEENVGGKNNIIYPYGLVGL